MYSRFAATIRWTGGFNTVSIGETGTVAAGDLPALGLVATIRTDRADNSVFNAGLIQATVKDSGYFSFAVDMLGTNSTIVNSGTILAPQWGV